jgi:hypothetical protein
MTTISTKYKILTLINVFTVTPAKQEELSQLLIDAAEQTMKHLPGFISANITKALMVRESSIMPSGTAGRISRS